MLTIPNCCISDNIPFNSLAFRQFSNNWSFKSVTTSPDFPQSNGLAKKGVGMAKSMLQKANETNVDLELYLLNYQSSPEAGLSYSHAEILQNRNFRTKLPVNENLLKPKIPINLQEDMIKNQITQKKKKHYDKNTKREGKCFKIGDSVLWLKNNKWEVGMIVGKANTPRSYFVRDVKGKQFRRTTEHLKLVFLNN